MQEEEEGVEAVGGGGLYKVGMMSVAGPLETHSYSVFSSSPSAALVSGVWRTFPGSLWSWAGCGAVSHQHFTGSVCSKCRKSTKIFCRVLT